MKQNIANGHAMPENSDGVTDLHIDKLFQDDRNLPNADADRRSIKPKDKDRVTKLHSDSSLQENRERLPRSSTTVRLRFESCSTALRLLFDYASRVVRLRFDCCSTALRLLFDYASTALRLVFGYASTKRRRVPEGFPNNPASSAEQVSTNLASVVQAKCKTSAHGFDRITPSISDQECTANVPLVYGECTGGVLKRYQKGTEEVLKKYQKGTKDIPALRTSPLARLWLARNGRVGAAYSRCAAVIVIVFCFNFCLFNVAAFGQSRTQSEAAAEVVSVTPLQIGDTIPEELWHLPLQVVNHPDGKDTITLNDYRDRKLIILDFWATWCGPCIKSLHKLDTLQRQYMQDVSVLPITYETESKALPIIKKENWRLPSIIDEARLKDYFPHRFIPHQVWIREGKVTGVPGSADVTTGNIRRFIADNTFTLVGKRDVLDYSSLKHIGIYADRQGVPVYYSSSLLPYIEGLPSSRDSRKNSTHRFTNYINVKAILMYSAALGTPYNKIKVVSSNLKNEAKPNSPETGLCYQLIAPVEMSDEQVNNNILKDLNTYFGVCVEKKVIQQECFVIKRLLNESTKDKPAAITAPSGEGTVQSFNRFVGLLNFYLDWRPDQHIYIDESGYSGMVRTSEYRDLQKDSELLQSTLQQYGLTAIKETRPIEFYVIMDANQQY